MSDIAVLVVEDEPEVRTALLRDLEPFAGLFRVEATGDATEAAEVVEEILSRGDVIGLVLCDHLLPGERGTDFLVRLNSRPETTGARKVLITGQAGHDDTIRAINDADLDHYIAKPWTRRDLHDVVRRQLTDFVIARGEDLLRYVPVLEGERLIAAAGRQTWSH